MIAFYCGIGEQRWNHHPVTPGALACVAPVKGRSERTQAANRVFIPEGVQVIQDSGAFSDSWNKRLSFQAALDRQTEHAERFDYVAQITHRASYDLLIDEVWTDGNRSKRRWSVIEAERAVQETIASAQFLAEHRGDLHLIQSAQGVDARQYLACARRVVDYIGPGDWFGLGGWCIIGKMPHVMLPVFRETLLTVIPFVARKGIQHIHIWGVIYPYALGELLWMCDQHEITVSTDSAGPCLAPCFGQWGYGNWRDNTYHRPEPAIRGLERARHVQLTREWLTLFRTLPYYRAPKTEAHQLSLWEVA